MDADKIQKFFIHHCEKMILVVVIGASGFLVYSGWQLPNFLETQQPDRLGQDATQVKSDIDLNHNDEIIPPRLPTIDIVERTEKLYTPVDSFPYEQIAPWKLGGADEIVRRQDPLLPAPRAIHLTSVATSIAVRGSATDPEDYDLTILEPAEPVEMVVQPKVRERRPKRRRGGGMEEDMMEDMMEEEDMMDMEEMDMGDYGESMSGPNRKFNSKFDFGMRPVPTQDKRNPKPALGWFIAGTAVVPHKQLYEAYEFALRDASQYDPRRDTPRYFNIEVQRADVTGKTVDQLVEKDWIMIWDRTLYTKLGAGLWSGFAPEVVPGDYCDDALTMWIPPVLLDDYRTFALHPQVPMISPQELKSQLNQGDDIIEFDIFSLEPGEDERVLVGPGGRPGMGGGMDMGMEDMMDMMDMEEMGEMGMMGMGMAMFGRGAIERDPVEHKLIRFYDFAGIRKPNTPQPGHQYVYRLRYAVVDPNFPFAKTMQPKISNLGPEVAKRVQAKMAEAIQTGRRAFQRWSDWSEPSEPASLPSGEQYFAGPVNPGTVYVWTVDDKEIEYTREPPSAKIVASKYDVTGARVPMQLDIFEGSVLSHKVESADVVDPITLKVLKMPEAELISGTTVVGLDGGKPLWKVADGLTQPGLMLLFDQTGKLKVTDEVSDQEFYRIYTYAEERGEL